MYRVTRFVEKPDAEKARAFLADGRYPWNSGMFVFSAARYLEELDRYRPDVLAAASRATLSPSSGPGRRPKGFTLLGANYGRLRLFP